MRKRVLSLLMALVMVIGMLPTSAFAVEDTGLCEHHTAHDDTCGYVAAVEGSSCTHKHSESCYQLVSCRHTCGEECKDGCAHVCTVESGCITMEKDCHHTHGDCGYAEAVEARDCTTCPSVVNHVEGCDEVDCACEAVVTHGGEGCTYVEGRSASPCNHVCSIESGCYKLLCSHKDGGHDDTCGYVPSVEGHDCGYVCEKCAAACSCETKCAGDSVNADCPVCGAEDADLSACTGKAPETPAPCIHTGGSATCKEKAVCDICHQPYGELAGHTYNQEGVCEVCGTTCAHESAKDGVCLSCGMTLTQTDAAVEAVRSAINALPTVDAVKAMTEEEQDALLETIFDIEDAYQALTEDQQAVLAAEYARMMALVEVLYAGVAAYALQLSVVLPDGKTINLGAESTYLVEGVKGMIQEKTDIPPEKQILVYNGTRLEDGKTLADYGIPVNGTLYLYLHYHPVCGETCTHDENKDGTLDHVPVD